ncbi:hypothetical protein SAMN04487914_108121 [Arthrobacter sp. ok909]|uniref:hypothetical protein n=1 Tax=Arthrobacter sp. ok909 TaxID=1761746 RepID=UPI0008904863|nr:hypothetical protein [Arthrobacter sp. ok909]SDP33825.1 hypothetical protein SAMN04487914_108121 [Arthrobacter sp. ok909]
MARYTRISLMNGITHLLTKEEADFLAQAKVKGVGVVDIDRLNVRIVPHQVIDFSATNQPDNSMPAIEAPAYKRPTGHKHYIDTDLTVRCSCGRRVFTVLVNRQLERKEWTRLSGSPGYNFVYEDGGMVTVATTRYVCSLEQIPDGMTHCTEAEYTRFRPVTSWLQRV